MFTDDDGRTNLPENYQDGVIPSQRGEGWWPIGNIGFVLRKLSTQFYYI